ncbi:MAG: TonB family protein [Pyrinomonadaceae bacterium]|nr:TonB family protein [Pyrinomonadaceae bacterium]
MLDQLVESKSTVKENSRRSGFMMVTFVIMFALLLSGWVYSLFAKDYLMGSGDLELSTLVAPVPVPEDEPPPPKPENEPEKKAVEKADTNVDVRKEIIANIMESPTVPPKVNTQQTDAMARRLGAITKVGSENTNAAGIPSGTTRTVDPGTGGLTVKPAATPDTRDEDEPPPPKPTPKPVPKTISGGVVNGKALSLPQPAYPAAAKAVGAKGSVSVQVLISEDGSVISANAASGHPLLRSAAESAARRARFKPTELSGQPVKVSGVITYVFN